MARLRRVRSVFRVLARVLVGLVVLILILTGLVLTVIETGWAKNRIRDLIVRQANQYLTATLSIGRLEGSLVRGIQLGGIALSRDGHPLITIEEVALSYSLRELFESGTIIRRIRLLRPRIVATRQSDGRWDLAALVKRERREEERTGPARPIEIQSIEIFDGHIAFRNPLDFGAVHAPTQFDKLNASFSFAYRPVRWHLRFDRMSWIGRAPDLTMNNLSGTFGVGSGGWFFEKLLVQTPRSAFTLDGRIVRGERPTELALTVNAGRFAFQEWSGILRGLRNIAVEASFDTSLTGPLTQLATEIRLDGTGGSVQGRLTLDTTVPGWHGAGAVDVGRLDLSRWLNRPDRPSDITGHVTFDLALELGRRFPRGVYTFAGPHAMYMNYAAANVQANGQITSAAVLVARATGTAYGARVLATGGSIAIDDPYPYRFHGTVTQIDLRNLPDPVPVPHVESLLTFDYDVVGTFSNPFITGHATFAQSTFLGAMIGPGTTGSIDTSQKPMHYQGEGDLASLSVNRFGEGLDVAWMRDPRYAGTLAGRFHVDGYGSGAAALSVSGGGRLIRADMFKGTMTDADVSVNIDHGTLRASYAGRLAEIDPAVAFADPRFDASLTGSGDVTVTVRDLLLRNTTLADYDVTGSLDLQSSTVRRIAFETAHLRASLKDSRLSISRLEASGGAIEGRGSGVVSFEDEGVSDFEYDVTRADLAELRPVTGGTAAGVASTKGRVTGPRNALHAAGEASISSLDAFDVQALTLTGTYDATIRPGGIDGSAVRVEGKSSFLSAFGQSFREASGTVTVDDRRLGFDLRLTQAEGRAGTIAGAVLLHPDRRSADIQELTIGLGAAPWRLTSRQGLATVSWTDDGFAVTPVTFMGGNGEERIDASGTWRSDGTGALRVAATHVFLETLQGAFERPARYGGVLDADVTIRGTRQRPLAAGTIAVTNGRVERVSYEKLAGRIDFADRRFTIDLRLDQAPGIWITANGSVPMSFFEPSASDEPMKVTLKSSGISLGLVEGLTDAVRDVSGELRIDVDAIGTARDPHFDGEVIVEGAAFRVTATGSRYRNARAALALTRDRVTVEVLHVEDANGRTLDVHGSLATHELRVADLAIDATARRFEILRNEFGRIEADARLQLRGRFESPRVTGELTIASGELKVDEILQRVLFQPYATEATAIADVDTAVAQTTWDRFGLDFALHVPNTLRLVGEDVQVSAGTPIGLGDIRLRVRGDLYFYKDPGDRLYLSGSFDQVSGTYAFQGRRFDVDPISSIVFRGDVNPELYLAVTRVISGVQVRVSLIGPMRQPELRLASTPPLDETDILSLVVFNTSSNQLSAAQQQELVVRAGALAAGFLAAPILTAIENQIGLDVLEIEPGGDFGEGPKVTVGEEIAPGLVARFSRQFGPEPYDEATVEYYLSRILRLRATFSDAQSLVSRSLFRRVERAGIDLIVFFSF